MLKNTLLIKCVFGIKKCVLGIKKYVFGIKKNKEMCIGHEECVFDIRNVC